MLARIKDCSPSHAGIFSTGTRVIITEEVFSLPQEKQNVLEFDVLASVMGNSMDKGLVKDVEVVNLNHIEALNLLCTTKDVTEDEQSCVFLSSNQCLGFVDGDEVLFLCVFWCDMISLKHE